jgi:hypothetical protein
MGQMLNAFSLEESEIASAIERTGSAMDVNHASTSGMVRFDPAALSCCISF